jgi:hypothetical protein
MGRLSGAAATVGLALAMAAPAVAADNVWVVDKVGSTSASVLGPAGNMSLIVGCAAPNLVLALSGSGVDVDPKGDVSVAIGKASFPLAFGRARTALLLNNRTDGAAGITDELYAALRTGKSAQLSGTAFAAAPVESLSFSLEGSGAALATVRADCAAALPAAN